MIVRCYDVKTKKRQRTYKNCTVCDEWRYLSNFVRWVDSQPNRNWQNCDLDKDILFEGNKMYSPVTCVFVETSVNRFMIGSDEIRGDYMIGVKFTLNGKSKPYLSRCSNPFNKERLNGYVGYFTTELEAHKAWQAKKHEYACQLADLQEDERVAKALRERYAPDKDRTER